MGVKVNTPKSIIFILLICWIFLFDITVKSSNNIGFLVFWNSCLNKLWMKYKSSHLTQLPSSLSERIFFKTKPVGNSLYSKKDLRKKLLQAEKIPKFWEVIFVNTLPQFFFKWYNISRYMVLNPSYIIWYYILHLLFALHLPYDISLWYYLYISVMLLSLHISLYSNTLMILPLLYHTVLSHNILSLIYHT